MLNHSFLDLKGKVVIIIGGFGLIGKALCDGFVSSNSRLIIADQIEDSHFIKKMSNQKKGIIDFLRFDITQESNINQLIKYVVHKYKKIDVFINSSWPRTEDWSTDVERVSPQSVNTNLANHLGGYFSCTQKIALQMKKQKFGSIINFSSIYGLVAPTFSIYKGTNMTSPPAYPLIKGGINSMTKYFASYFGKYNVRVNCISPGGVYRNENKKFVNNYSKLTPLGRMATPDDLVMPTLFLASEGSRYITGHNLVVDGGWTIH